MKRTMLVVVTTAFLGFMAGLAACGAALSVCSYEPPESRISDFGLLGSFNWYDGPFADDRNRTMSASLVGDYTGIYSSAAFGQALDARTEIRADGSGWAASVFGSGSLSSFFAADTPAYADIFGVGVVGFSASTQEGLELDLTGGLGTGRFRDVTPLAQAISIQNELLDLGELLAPVSNETLLDLAQILGSIDLADDEKVVTLVAKLVSTELVSGQDLDVRGLLAIEEILKSSDVTRLCGRDLQARLGVSAMVYPEFSVASTGIVLIRYAAVPDPVSQFNSSAEAKIRLAHPEQMNIKAGASYTRRLPDGWTARAEYRVTVDRLWTTSNVTATAHAASGSLTTKIFGSVGLSLVGSLQYRTGDEEMTSSLAVYMETDLF
ncbi:hypothetical protein KKG90_02095 [Candidatus Bipolaricaulota bacterium]|nr:hypothetical protein [Candidatus Bipolaricaulota bacterium]